MIFLPFHHLLHVCPGFFCCSLLLELDVAEGDLEDGADIFLELRGQPVHALEMDGDLAGEDFLEVGLDVGITCFLSFCFRFRLLRTFKKV